MRKKKVIIFEGEQDFVAPKNTVYDSKTGKTYVVPEEMNVIAPTEDEQPTGGGGTVTDQDPLIPPRDVGTPAPTPPAVEVTTSSTTTTTTKAPTTTVNVGTLPITTMGTPLGQAIPRGGGGGSPEGGKAKKSLLKQYWWVLLIVAGGVGYYIYTKRKNK